MKNLRKRIMLLMLIWFIFSLVHSLYIGDLNYFSGYFCALILLIDKFFE